MDQETVNGSGEVCGTKSTARSDAEGGIAINPQAVYLEMYKEWRNHLRHHESQRSTMTTVTFALAGITGGYITNYFDKHSFVLCVPSLFLVVLGITAYVLTQKQYERMQRALAMSDVFQAALDGFTHSDFREGINRLEESLIIEHNGTENPNKLESNRFLEGGKLLWYDRMALNRSEPSLTLLMHAAELVHFKKNPRFYRTKLHQVWNLFFALLSITGVVLLCFYALYKNKWHS